MLRVCASSRRCCRVWRDADPGGTEVKPEVRGAANAAGRAAYAKARAEGKSRTDADYERARARYQSVSIAAGTKRYVTGLSDEERHARRLNPKQEAHQRKIGRPDSGKRTPE